MPDEEVAYRIDDGVATITINRPERRNALNPEVLSLLIERFGRARSSPEVRVVVLTGAGDRAFSAGGDLAGGMFGEGFLGLHEGRGRLVDLFRTMKGVGKPIVARVNGYALGGGFGLMLACDLAVAVDTAKMGTPEIDIGLFPMMIMPVIFRNIGRKAGMELILTGKKVEAREALALGLVNRVVPAAELDAAVGELAATLKKKSQAVLRLGRDAFYAMADMTEEEAFEYLKAMISINTLLEDAAEGISAFVGKRDPVWKDR